MRFFRYRCEPARVLALLVFLASGACAQTDLDRLLALLPEGKLDDIDLWKIEAQPPDPRTLTALRAAFEKREAKNEKQWIAASLLRLGDKSDRYFEYLAGFAREAVADLTPVAIRVPGHLTPEFEIWCKVNRKDPKPIAKLQLYDHPVDVKMLAEVQDTRAIQIFRAGSTLDTSW